MGLLRDLFNIDKVYYIKISYSGDSVYYAGYNKTTDMARDMKLLSYSQATEIMDRLATGRNDNSTIGNMIRSMSSSKVLIYRIKDGCIHRNRDHLVCWTHASHIALSHNVPNHDIVITPSRHYFRD